MIALEEGGGKLLKLVPANLLLLRERHLLLQGDAVDGRAAVRRSQRRILIIGVAHAEEVKELIGRLFVVLKVQQPNMKTTASKIFSSNIILHNTYCTTSPPETRSK